MARPLRITYPGALYHITARGNEKRKIFLSRGDYEKFKRYAKEAGEKYDFVLRAYVLMPNHYHLIGETPQANLSEVMHYINSSYTTYFNRKRQRSGHLFQGRYKSILVDKDGYLLELSRYIHLNPVRAGIAEGPEKYPYSSYRAYINESQKDIVAQDLLLSMMSGDAGESRARYRRFVEHALGGNVLNPFKNVYGGAILGLPAFIKSVLQDVDEAYSGRDEVSSRRLLRPISLEDILRMIEKTVDGLGARIRPAVARNMAIYCAKTYTGLTNRQIGEFFGNISYSAVAKAKERFEKLLQSDGGAKDAFQKMKEEMSRFKGSPQEER